MTRSRLACLIIAPLLLASPACKRSTPEESQTAPARRTADPLMPRNVDQRPRVQTSEGGLIPCKEQVNSVPCGPIPPPASTKP